MSLLFCNVLIRAKLSEQWCFREICSAHTMLGPVILLYTGTVMVSVGLYICTVIPGATLASSVEVPLTNLKMEDIHHRHTPNIHRHTGVTEYRDRPGLIRTSSAEVVFYIPFLSRVYSTNTLFHLGNIILHTTSIEILFY